MVDLMNLEDQVDLDFVIARRRARLGKLKALLLRRSTRGTLLSLPRSSDAPCRPAGLCIGVEEQSR